MDPILQTIRYIIGSPYLNDSYAQDLFNLFEWLVAALVFLICVSFVFKILYKLLTR